MTERLIELDVSVEWQPAEDPVLPHHPRPWTAAVVVLITTFLLAAAGDRLGLAPPVLQPPESSQALLVTDDRVYTVTQPAYNPVTLNAFQLPTGVLLWSVPMRQGFVITHADDRHVIVFGGGMDPHNGIVDVLDAATGKTVWQRAGIDGADLAGDVVLAESTPDPDTTADPPFTYTAVAVDSGTSRWTVTTPGRTLVTAVYDPGADDGDFAQVTGMAELDPDRTMRFRDVRTGKVQRTVKLAGAEPVNRFQVADGRVLTYADDSQYLGAYDLASGRHLWGGQVEQMASFLNSCGPVLCQEADGRVLGLDPDTGRVRWGFDSPNGYTMLNDRRVVVIQSPLTADGRRTDALLVDADTGAVRRRLGSWRFLSGLGGDRLLVWRSDDKGHATLGALDAKTGSVEVIGTGKGWYGEPDCQTSTIYVACEDMLSLSVWRLPASTMR
jgi:outer membrane protein assembly factor BamB